MALLNKFDHNIRCVQFNYNGTVYPALAVECEPNHLDVTMFLQYVDPRDVESMLAYLPSEYEHEDFIAVQFIASKDAEDILPPPRYNPEYARGVNNLYWGARRENKNPQSWWMTTEFFKMLVAHYDSPLVELEMIHTDWQTLYTKQKSHLQINGVPVYFNDNLMAPCALKYSTHVDRDMMGKRISYRRLVTSALVLTETFNIVDWITEVAPNLENFDQTATIEMIKEMEYIDNE